MTIWQPIFVYEAVKTKQEQLDWLALPYCQILSHHLTSINGLGCYK